jgi:hypothetical protein
VVALLATDRLLVRVVEHRLATRLGCMSALTGARSVRIGGFPFVTQLATGHYQTVTVTADGFGQAQQLTDLSVTFHDVEVPSWSGVFRRWGPGSVTVGSVSLTAVLRLGSLAPALPGGWPPRLLGSPSAATGRPPIALIPPGAHLDAVVPVPGGLRLAATIPGAALAGVAGRTCDG